MNWKTKSAAAIVAGGLAGAGDAGAQPVGTNLVQNPSFETLDASNNVTQWTGAALATYQYSQGYTSSNIPPGAGANYLHGAAAASSTTNQTIDLLAAGFTAAFLDSAPLYSLNAWFSTYTSQNDFATIRAQFLDAGGTPVGTSNTIGSQAFVAALGRDGGGFADWGQDATGGTLTPGT